MSLRKAYAILREVAQKAGGFPTPIPTFHTHHKQLPAPAGSLLIDLQYCKVKYDITA